MFLILVLNFSSNFQTKYNSIICVIRSNFLMFIFLFSNFENANDYKACIYTVLLSNTPYNLSSSTMEKRKNNYINPNEYY